MIKIINSFYQVCRVGCSAPSRSFLKWREHTVHVTHIMRALHAAHTSSTTAVQSFKRRCTARLVAAPGAAHELLIWGA